MRDEPPRAAPSLWRWVDCSPRIIRQRRPPSRRHGFTLVVRIDVTDARRGEERYGEPATLVRRPLRLWRSTSNRVVGGFRRRARVPMGTGPRASTRAASCSAGSSRSSEPNCAMRSPALASTSPMVNAGSRSHSSVRWCRSRESPSLRTQSSDLSSTGQAAAAVEAPPQRIGSVWVAKRIEEGRASALDIPDVARGFADALIHRQ